MNFIDGWASGDVLANGLRLHYYRSGGNGRPVVLAHGITDSGQCWPRLASALAPAYDLVAYDARGHGHSETPPGPYTSLDQAEDLFALVEELGLRRPVAIGHSMGAQTVSLVAARHTGLLAGAVLEDPPWRDVPAAPGGGPGEYRRRLREYRALTVEALVAYGRAHRTGWAEEELCPWAQAKHRCSAEALENMVPGGPDWRAVAAGIECPTLLLTGDPNVQAMAGLGAIVTPAVAELACQLSSHIQVVQVAGAGHNIRREAFDAYRAAVLGFLHTL
ncbi:MAG: alpha/beta hydrolase [Chloroflexi bacterium]|nr:alpha/beta hydrolase [Chloroflexota bacterium]